MRSRLALLFASAIAATAIAAGCGGGAKNGAPIPSPSPSPSPTPTVTPPPGAVVESEPNDVQSGDPPTAIAGTGAQTFFGVCADDNDFDFFVFTAGSGMIAAQMSWTESAANDDLDLYVDDTSMALQHGDDAIPPSDSPAMVAFDSTNAGLQFYVEVRCYNTSPNVAYTGSLTIP